MIKNIHQEANARVIEKNGGALLILEPDCTSRLLYDVAREILADPHRLRSMSSAMLSLARPDAVDAIVKELLELAVKKEN
jgi:UDP-N-acetylglucosamine--N-acetylmuramyl-(pentapeptide) pyrophosphoryl-undecaprenol N-acetylglucosamine transferase